LRNARPFVANSSADPRDEPDVVLREGGGVDEKIQAEPHVERF
jgi:hypothetical protein